LSDDDDTYSDAGSGISSSSSSAAAAAYKKERHDEAVKANEAKFAADKQRNKLVLVGHMSEQRRLEAELQRVTGMTATINKMLEAQAKIHIEEQQEAEQLRAAAAAAAAAAASTSPVKRAALFG